MQSLPSTCEVLIIGAGVSGASTAYHLSQAGVDNIVVIDSGTAGDGVTNSVHAPGHAQLETEKVFSCAKRSGSAVLSSAPTIKMMVRLYATSSSEFIKHHGVEGARRYLKLTALGIQYEKSLGEMVLPSPDTQLRHTGSLYVAPEEAVGDLLNEFFTLQELGCTDIEWWDHARLQQTAGCASQFFCAIYFPGDAIIDSSTYAAALLMAAVDTGRVQLFEGVSPAVNVLTLPASGSNSNSNSNSCSSSNASRASPMSLTELENGVRILSQHVVLCTGGLFPEASLAGILRPCWSYLVLLPHPCLQQPRNQQRQQQLTTKNQWIQDNSAIANEVSGRGTVTHHTINNQPFANEEEDEDEDEGMPILPDGTPKYSYNFFTWGFTHDWCWTRGAVRVSGEDHYSAFKPPRVEERCQSLAHWVERMYPQIFLPNGVTKSNELPTSPMAITTGSSKIGVSDRYDTQYGVYSETPDFVPIVGHATPHSRVCYLLGCNAWGQAVMSYASTLVPGLLGYVELSDEQRDLLKLLTVRRFSLLQAVQGHGQRQGISTPGPT